MLIIVDNQLRVIKDNRTTTIQTVNENDRFRATRVFGIRESVAAAMAKGLCYTSVKGV